MRLHLNLTYTNSNKAHTNCINCTTYSHQNCYRQNQSLQQWTPQFQMTKQTSLSLSYQPLPFQNALIHVVVRKLTTIQCRCESSLKMIRHCHQIVSIHCLQCDAIQAPHQPWPPVKLGTKRRFHQMSACIHRKRANLTTCIQCNCLFSNEQNRRSVIKRLDDAYTFLSRIYFIVMNGAVHDELNTRKLTIIHDVRRNLMRNVVINVIKKWKDQKL